MQEVDVGREELIHDERKEERKERREMEETIKRMPVLLVVKEVCGKKAMKEEKKGKEERK